MSEWERNPRLFNSHKFLPFQDEPLNASLDLGECKPLEAFCRKGFNSGFSYKATDPQTGDIVGAAVCLRIHQDDKPDAEEEELYKSHEKFHRIMEISEYAYDRIDLFGRYPNCREMLQVEVVSVARSHRGQGIATRMLEEVLEEAKRREIPVVYCQCSSDFMAKLVRSLEFTEVFSIAYEHYKKDGVQTLSPPPPHDHLRVYIKWLGPIPK